MHTVSEQTLFSILIANYNNGQYLLNAVESVRNQTYTSWEIILVDDGSTDNSHQLYKELRNDSRIRIFLNDQNQGCGYTKRRCAEEARGEFCAFLDPDDALAPEALKKMVAAFNNHPEASLIYSTHYLCDSSLKPVKINPTVQPVPKFESYLTSKDLKISISHFAAFPLERYKITIGIDPILKRAVDQDLYYKLEETGKLVFLNLPLYYYRIHENGISAKNNISKARYWHALVIQNAYRRRLKTTGPKNIKKAELNRYFSQYFLWKAMEKKEKSEKCKALYCLWKSFHYSAFDKNFGMRFRVLAGLLRPKK